ncbi:hypothetical protein DACRYDRAFT_24700 [Dacryopinax primogenitus]|uniref:Uncharacterized protein n=1 Tax=Dacryopinax primogenitus (strain DJM 731) TaxID=1858805 RepID=M5FP55_DACPD|nr:uncharacterized protein DACRYDRAFT_24700 [Dacryopinax primogenitus]EJT98230.1 hypothetical protein DACRYDRAFT_24700 [Dacryopinax primogenitus]
MGAGAGGDGEAIGNRPRSKSHTSLSQYFGTSPVVPHDISSISLPVGYDPRPEGEEEDDTETDAETVRGRETEGEGEETETEARRALLFPPAAPFSRAKSLTDMPTLSGLSYPPQPPAYSRADPAFTTLDGHAGPSVPILPPVHGLDIGRGTAIPGRKEAWRVTLEDVNLRLLNRGRNRRAKTVRSDTETETEPLPTARIPPPKPRSDRPPLARLVPLFMFFCRGLSIVPAVLGTCWHLYLAYKIPWRWGPFSENGVFRFGPVSPGREGEDIVGMGGMDHAIVSCWSIATGVWCYLLASGLLRRWLTYYSLFPTLIRQLSLQAICWSSTHLTIQVFGPSRPLTAWVVIGTTTSISHSVQIWVTSNIRLASKDERESRRWFAVPLGLDYWLGKRKMDWAKVVRQSGIPLFVLYFVTCWTMLLDRELISR